MRVGDEKNLAHSVTDGNNILIEQRRGRIIELRVAGLTLKQIAEQIDKEYGEKLPRQYSEALIHQDITIMLSRRDIESMKYVNEVKKLELERLDSLWMVAYGMALNGDIKAMNMCLRIMERRTKYLGADAPDKVKVNVRDWRSDILELIKSGKFSVEQVREELGTEIYTRLLESGSNSADESGIIDVESGEDSEG